MFPHSGANDCFHARPQSSSLSRQGVRLDTTSARDMLTNPVNANKG
jgi:hypothetical protein